MAEPKPKTAAEEVFATEFAVLATAERIAAEGLPNGAEWQREFSELARKYRALLKQAVKMTGIGDATQSRLLRIQHELEAKNRELLEKPGPYPRPGSAPAIPGACPDDFFQPTRKPCRARCLTGATASNAKLALAVMVRCMRPRTSR